jgi:hypothetical protein
MGCRLLHAGQTVVVRSNFDCRVTERPGVQQGIVQTVKIERKAEFGRAKGLDVRQRVRLSGHTSRQMSRGRIVGITCVRNRVICI